MRLDYLKRLHFYWSTFRCNITLLQSCNIMIESGWLHVVSSSTTLDMIGLLSSRNTTYQDLAEAAVRLLVVLVKKRKKSVLECFFSFAEAAVDAREALLCRLFFCHIWQKVMAENPRSIDKKCPLFITQKLASLAFVWLFEVLWFYCFHYHCLCSFGVSHRNNT